MKKIRTITMIIALILTLYTPIASFATEKDETCLYMQNDTKGNSLTSASDIDAGSFRGITWRITSDWDLIIGAINTTQTYVGGSEYPHPEDYPWHPYRESIKTISFNGTVIASGSISEIFSDCLSLTEIDFDNFNTSNVTDMSALLCNDASLVSIKNISKLNTGKVTDMGMMFAGLTKIKELDMSHFDTGNVEDMGHMFYSCKSLTNLDLASFDTSNVYEMWSMFEYCSGLKDINLSSFDVRNLNIMPEMFKGCTSLSTIDLSSFDTSNVQNMEDMFDSCNSLKELKLGKWSYKNIDSYNKYFPVFPKTMYDRDDGNQEYEAGEVIPEYSFHTFAYDDVYQYITEKEAHGLIPIQNKVIPEKYGFYFKDSYFNSASTKYNHSLATMSLCMAFSTYGIPPYDSYDEGIKYVMRNCGLTGKNYSNYKEYDFNKKPTSKSIGCAIGSKKLKNGSILIAVAIRSSGYEAEWASNFEVGLDGDHKGFSDSANIVYEDIADYIKEKKIEGKIKIWITGFSRGAAVATHTAAKLNNGSFKNVTYSKSDVYAYGFATPAGAISSNKPNSSQYNNIFNIIHYHDIVPLVAPEKWGFGRYGTTYLFPFTQSQLISARYETKMKKYLKGMGTDYELDAFFGITEGSPLVFGSVGLFNRELIDNIATNIGVTSLGVGARAIYKNNLQKTVTNAANTLMSYGLDEETLIQIMKNPEVYRLLIKTGASPYMIATAVKNGGLLARAHAEPTYYLAWMQVMDVNYGSELTPTFSKGNVRYIRVNCPVDINVYDANNCIVASIKNEKVANVQSENKIEAFIDVNGQKSVMLPVDSDYQIEIIARDNGDVDYRVEEAAGVSSELTRIVNFKSVKAEKGTTFLASADDYSEEEIEEDLSDGSSTVYNLEMGGKKIQIESEYRGDKEIQEHSFLVSVKYNEEQGTIYGAGKYTEGEFVQLTAECKPGYEIEGFYSGGDKLNEDDIDKNPNTIRFKVENDIEVTAKFRKHIHSFNDWYITNAATELTTGQKKRTCATCGYEETIFIKQLEPTLKEVKISKPKVTQKSAIIKWKKVSRGNLKYTKQIEIQYSLDKSFNTGVKTKYTSARKTSIKLKKLKRRKKYYVRIRAYTNSNETIHISKWSAIKKIRIK